MNFKEINEKLESGSESLTLAKLDEFIDMLEKRELILDSESTTASEKLIDDEIDDLVAQVAKKSFSDWAKCTIMKDIVQTEYLKGDSE